MGLAGVKIWDSHIEVLSQLSTCMKVSASLIELWEDRAGLKVRTEEWITKKVKKVFGLKGIANDVARQKISHRRGKAIFEFFIYHF